MNKTEIKIFSSKILACGICLIVLCSYGLLIFCLMWDKVKEDFLWYHWIIFVFYTGLLPTMALILSAKKVFAIITINDKGIKRSVFKIFFKYEMQWNEINEIRYVEHGLPFLFFSKNKNINEMNFNVLTKQKEIIGFALNRKVYKILKQYIEQPIEGLDEDKIKKLKLNDIK